jgi:hypothetical protein
MLNPPDIFADPKRRQPVAPQGRPAPPFFRSTYFCRRETMTKAEFADLLARRAGKSRTQIQRQLNWLHEHGILRLTMARRTPPDVHGHDAALILLAALVGAENTVAASNLTARCGERLGDVLELLLDGPPCLVGHLIARPDGASITIDGRHIRFGDPEAAGPAGYFPGATLMAIAAEYQGAAPTDAEAVAALTQIRGI